MNNEINIVKLAWNEAIRTRAGMYIGATENPSVLLREAIDNSIDELYGYDKTDSIYISTSEKDWNIVADSGRGIPIVWDDENKMTKTHLAVTSTHTGSKFNKEDVAIGLNGVGLSATNALSESFVMISRVTEHNYDKSIKAVADAWLTEDHSELFYYIEFSKGELVEEGCLTQVGIENKYDIHYPKGMSTITAFKPDSSIFENLRCSIPKRNLSYVLTILNKIYNRKVSIVVNGQLVNDTFNPYKFEILTEVRCKNTKGEVRPVKFYINFECDTNLGNTDFSGSVNSLVCDRGLHLDIAKSAYSEALKSVFNLSYNNVLCGLKLNCIIVATEVDFSSQTKERCTKIEGIQSYELVKALIPSFKKVFKSEDDYFQDHIARLDEYIASLTKISTINKIKNAISTIGVSSGRVRSKVPKSVRDASIKDRKKAELFIVEGKSASGSILNTRDARYQAVLELRGVPLNSINKDLDEIFDNEEMKSLIVAVGIGVNEYHDLKWARYGKLIIATDADSDGYRIASLVLGMIATRMTFLLQHGMVYVLRSPLYIQKQGDEEVYIYPEDKDLLDRDKPYTRIKGLGELNEDQAYSIIVNPDTRRLLRITPENVNEALSLLSSSSARKQLMIDKSIVVDPYNHGVWT